MSLAGRPSQRTVRHDHVYGWKLVENPDWPSEHGEITAACHDGTPHLTIICGHCDAPMHIHESQIAGMVPADELVTRCKGSCGRPMLLGGKYLLGAFAEVKKRMRATG